jgi:hypothetical protein
MYRFQDPDKYHEIQEEGLVFSPYGEPRQYIPKHHFCDWFDRTRTKLEAAEKSWRERQRDGISENS